MSSGSDNPPPYIGGEKGGIPDPEVAWRKTEEIVRARFRSFDNYAQKLIGEKLPDSIREKMFKGRCETEYKTYDPSLYISKRLQLLLLEQGMLYKVRKKKNSRRGTVIVSWDPKDVCKMRKNSTTMINNLRSWSITHSKNAAERWAKRMKAKNAPRVQKREDAEAEEELANQTTEGDQLLVNNSGSSPPTRKKFLGIF